MHVECILIWCINISFNQLKLHGFDNECVHSCMLIPKLRWHSRTILIVCACHRIISIYYIGLLPRIQTLTVVIQASLQMGSDMALWVQSTPVKSYTAAFQDTHCKDQTEGPASPMESGVEVYLSAFVGSFLLVSIRLIKLATDLQMIFCMVEL